ncbi:MAG: YlbF family regulator, partial [Planctomycetota bacterium]
MDEVLELAAKLSRAIARSTRFSDLRKAEAAVMADNEAVDKMKERDAVLTKLQTKEQKGEPIEPDEKRELADLDEFVRTNTLLAELYRAQADFQE